MAVPLLRYVSVIEAQVSDGFIGIMSSLGETSVKVREVKDIFTINIDSQKSHPMIALDHEVRIIASKNWLRDDTMGATGYIFPLNYAFQRWCAWYSV